MTYIKRKYLFWIFLLITLTAPGSLSVQAQETDVLVIITNKKSAIDKITAAELKAVFLKQRGNLGGEKMVPIHAKATSALRATFQERVLAMDGAAETAYWEEMKIKNGVTAPIELSNTVKAVFSLSGALSYCFKKDFKPSVAKKLLEL